MAKKREDRSKEPARGFDSPFAGLAGLREALPEGEAPAAEPASEAREATAAKVVVRRERAGRGGKTVTVIEGLGPEREALAREMKKALGCGAVVEGEDLVLQGAQEERAVKWLRARGFTRVVQGTR